MKYDFTSIMDRVGKDSIAVDKIPYKDVEIKEGFSRLPMWVADMNFATGAYDYRGDYRADQASGVWLFFTAG